MLNISVFETSLRVFKTLAASISLRSKLNLAMAEASEDRNLVAGPSVEMELDSTAASVECKVCDVSFKLGQPFWQRKKGKKD